MPQKNFNQTIEVMTDLQGYFKPGERRLIYNACNTYRDKVLIRLLWKSGRRVSEVLGIKVEHIDFENRNILWNILKKKKKMRRWKPIDDFTLEVLHYYINKSGLKKGQYLIHGGYPDVKSISRQRVFDIIRALCKKCNIDYVGSTKPHPSHFRHSFAIDVARKAKSPADIRKVQMLMEHASLNITEQYLQFGNLDLRDLISDDNDKDE